MNTLYGPITIHEPILIDLISSKAVQRLKFIHQYGMVDYVVGPQHFTRYDHSIRVMTLLHIIKAPLLEQIAGLLHDVSHTVFSHLADVVFKVDGKDSYQDTVHSWYLEQTDIPIILKKYGINLHEILHKKGTFPALEQDLPDLCADRISYILDGGYIEKKLNQKQILEILYHVQYNDGIWFFDSYKHARLIADVALYLNEHIFAAPWNIVMNYWAAQAVNYALQHTIITQQDFHFGVDDVVWSQLTTNNDPALQKLIKKTYNVFASFSLTSENNFDLYITSKFRGVDPYIQIQGSLMRLSEYDSNFRRKYESLRDRVQQGWYVTFNEME